MTATVAVAAPRPHGRGLRTLAGTRELTKLALRRDRIMLIAWVYALLIIAASGGYGLKIVYKTSASRARLAASVRADPALSFIYGQLHGSSLGAIASWRYLAYAAIGAGLMSIFIVVRHTRADEETGRIELIGATAVGRNAPFAVAMSVAVAANVVVFALTTAALTVGGLPAAGAAAFGLGEAACGLVFAALAAIAAQVSQTARGARGLVIAALAVAFLLRAAGDAGASHGITWLTWLSPVGWAELLRPFAAERWWVLVVPVLATAAASAIAAALAARRDLGAGLLPQRPGPAAAGRLLAGPLGLLWRLERSSLAAWTAGFLVGGLAVGAITTSIGKLLGSSGAARDVFTRISGQAAFANAYLAACLSLFGLAAAAYAVAVVLRLRSDESAQLAEPILAAPVGRGRWGLSYLLVALAGTTAVLVAGGLGVGLAYGIAASDTGTQVPRLVEAGLAQLPAALAVAGVAAVLVAVLPRRATGLGWGVVAICGLIGWFGPAVKLPQSVLDVSPFAHVPKLPGVAVSATPLIWLGGVTLALAIAALAGLRHRDI